MSHKVLVRLGLALVAVWAGAAHTADAYPTRAVRMIIPFPPAGAGDILGRMLSVKLTESLGQQFVNDNRPGGGQVIATELAARAAPDGHTLYVSSITLAINPALIKKLPYDTVRDFTYITMIADSPLICVVNSGLGVSSIPDLVKLAKAKPGAINYGSSGPGTGGHLATELLKYTAGIDLMHVPYRGAAPALTDLIGGQLQLMCTSPLAALPHVKTGRIRAIAMTGARRSRAAPDVPTVAEQGYKGYQSSLWYGLLGPASMPDPIVKRLNGEINRVLKLPDIVEQLAQQGAEPVGGSSQETLTFVQSEIARWGSLISATKMKVQ
jgi:tripartite-type tricarboxylate transporter receptor subunit TctC